MGGILRFGRSRGDPLTSSQRGGGVSRSRAGRAEQRPASGSLFSGPYFYFFFLLPHGMLVHFPCVAHNRFCFSTSLSTWAEEKAATWQQRQPSE